MREKNSHKNVIIIITTITIICKLLGFLKNSVLAYYYGTSRVVDAYVMTFSIGTITSGWIAGLIGNFTPKFKEIEASKGQTRALLFSSQVLNLIMVMVVSLAIVLESIAPSVVKFVAPGFDNVTFHYTVHFFRLYIVSIFFYTIYRFSQEFLNCNQNHLAAVAPDLLMSSLCIVAIVISHYIGADYLILGYVVAILLQAIVTYSSSRKMGFILRKTKIWNNDLKELLGMAVPIFLSDTLANINNLIDKMFASTLESGIVAALDYSNTMKDFAFQVGTIAVITTFFPIISKFWAEKNINGFTDKVVQSLNIFTVLYTPLIVGIIFVGDVAIRIVFERGEFAETASVITSNAFIIYSISLIAMAYRSVFFKAFYAMQKTKYVLSVSAINVLLNIGLNLILVKRFGYIGLTSATTIASLISMPILFYLFKKTLTHISFRSYKVKLVKCIIAASLMGICLILIRHLMESTLSTGLLQDLVRLSLLSFSGITIYGMAGRLLKIEEVDKIYTSIVLLFRRVGNH